MPVNIGDTIIDSMDTDQRVLKNSYSEYLEKGLSREVARINLPVATYTEWYWQIDLHNLFHFLKLRLDAHAQWEIRQYAEVLSIFTKAVAPMSYSAFEEHILYSKTLSKSEYTLIREVLESISSDIDETKKKRLFKIFN